MTADTEEITRLFVSMGWTSLPLRESLINSRFSGVYVSGYAAIGVLLLSNSEEVITGWTDYQETMLHIRKQETVGSEKDLYLLLIVPKIDPNDASQLQPILDDTHVCRKILLERKDRSLIETLADSPFLGLNVTDNKTVAETRSLAEELGSQILPIPLLRDLATRSPRFVLSRAIQGEYGAT